MEKSIQMEHVRRAWKFRTVMAEIEQNTAKEIAKNLTFASVNLWTFMEKVVHVKVL